MTGAIAICLCSVVVGFAAGLVAAVRHMDARVAIWKAVAEKYHKLLREAREETDRMRAALRKAGR